MAESEAGDTARGDGTNRNSPGLRWPADHEWPAEWLGTYPTLYRPELWRPAADIKVAQFRQIYIWPLVLQVSRTPKEHSHDIGRAIEATIELLKAPGSPWAEIEDMFDHLPRKDAKDCGHSYAEFVYFHDYVQQVLFRPPQAHAPVHLFKHTAVEHAKIDLDGKRLLCFSVRRCNLYLFRNGAAVIAIELDAGKHPTIAGDGGTPRPLSLGDVQDFVDRARRCYAPFFGNDGTPQLVPKRLTWLNAARQPIVGGKDLSPLCDEFSRIKNAATPSARTAPLFAHWRELLAPLRLSGDEGHDGTVPVWRQIVDERIPAMSFVSLTGTAKDHKHYDLPKANPCQEGGAFQAMQDMRTVSRGDWLRLCYADRAGNDPLPYAPSFLHRFEDDACYDRYFPSESTDSATRYMFAGYHVAAVGAGWYFDDIIAQHFRRHYFQMGLILQMEFASLLAISSRIAQAVRNLHRRTQSSEQQDDKALALAYGSFRDDMIRIQDSFLETQHLFRFTGLSNQIQAREMHAKWRKAMDLDTLFEDLEEELESASQFLLSKEQAQQAAAANQQAIAAYQQAAAAVQQATAANNLSAIAAIGVVLGLAFAFLGANILMGDGMRGLLGTKDASSLTAMARELFVTGLVVAVAGGLGLFVSHLLGPHAQDPARLVARKVLRWILGFGLVCAVVGYAFGGPPDWLFK